METLAQGGYTIEELDALTGPLVGHAKSATFRTADVVGLDVLRDVTQNLYAKTEARREPRALPRARAPRRGSSTAGALGAKTKAGLLQEGRQGHPRSINPATRPTRTPKRSTCRASTSSKKSGRSASATPRSSPTRAASAPFTAPSTLDTLAYAARRIPEITASPGERRRRHPLGLWLGDGAVRGLGRPRLRHRPRRHEGRRATRCPAGSARCAPPARPPSTATRRGARPTCPGRAPPAATNAPTADESRPRAPSRPTRSARSSGRTPRRRCSTWATAWRCSSSARRPTASASASSRASSSASTRVENDPDLRGLVVGNEGANFAVGANLGEVAMMAAGGQWAMLEHVRRGLPAGDAADPLRVQAGRGRRAPAGARRRVRDGDGVSAPGRGGRELHRPRRAGRRADPGGHGHDAPRGARLDAGAERTSERGAGAPRERRSSSVAAAKVATSRADGAGVRLPRAPRAHRDERRPAHLRGPRRGHPALERGLPRPARRGGDPGARAPGGGGVRRGREAVLDGSSSARTTPSSPSASRTPSRAAISPARRSSTRTT